MKVEKFNEIRIVSNEDMDLSKKCKSLIFELWDDYFNISNLTLLHIPLKTGFRTGNINNYKLFGILYSPITNDSAEYYIQLLNILKKLNFEFSLNPIDKYYGLNIDITNIELFIKELETIKTSKNYNL